MKIMVEYKSIPKKRWRIGINKVHYNPVSKQENELAWKIKEYVLKNESMIEYSLPVLFDINCNIQIIGQFYSFYEKKRKKYIEVKRSSHRGDKDNHEKFILDAMKRAGIYKDDVQVVGGGLTFNHHPSNKFIIIDICPMAFSCCNDVPLLFDEVAKKWLCLFCGKLYGGDVFCL
jgi:Holliday junction resolvase RusA-like endonuclease